MAGDFIGIDIEGIPEVQAILRKLPKEAQGMITDDVAKYMVDVLRQYPPQKYVSRKDAYPDAPAGPGWFSEKQRRWFFANLGDLQIPYKRTQDYARGWRAIGMGPQTLVVNETPHASFLQDDDYQSRMAAKGGWQKLKYIIRDRTARIVKIADAAAQKAIRKLDKGSR